MAVIKDLTTVSEELQQQKERADTVNFKMVTFSLAGKEYGVDIMNVKEIAKADKFTYVPNAASYVKGVYNLRGDIIPIIDLRTFFHMPLERKNDGQENMLILHIEERVYGAIVDKIDKVVGINSETIQPPHPMFGEINIKFITGVVEKQGELYVILDVVRMFTQKEEEKQKTLTPLAEAPGEAYLAPPQTAPKGPPPPTPEQAREKLAALADTALGFIKESLAALKQFHASPINDGWIRKRFEEWSGSRKDADIQLKNAADADEYLSAFYSPDSGKFWSSEYAARIKDVLPNLSSNNIQVWNIGCGKGYETFSFACILKSRYPDGHIKIWANDSDIMAIANAPNMTFTLNEIPEYCRSFMVEGRNGHSFNQVIKDSIVFEYHDVLNNNQLPDLDIILVRDILSFFAPENQTRLISEFGEKLKNRGIVLLGKNEVLTGDQWRAAGKDPVSAFTHNK
ncbi:MAG: chemotaxis protein CheW [Spirochaetaceae bacterium]|jgi:purine-binding chemotaxis protein CheW|nr:chemotaxis protein CheW [Spirochaetaceae bacterium]